MSGVLDGFGVGGLCIITVVVVVGAALQRITGFGVGLVSMPVMAAISPSLVPATVLMIGLPIAFQNALRNMHDASVRIVTSVALSRMVGIVGGILLLNAVSLVGLQSMCLFVAALSLLSFVEGQALSWMSWWPVAGVLSGFMGTVTGAGGTPLAAAFRKLSLAESRGSASMVFLIGTTMSLGLLVVDGKVSVADVWASLVLLIPLALGAVVGNRYSDEVSVRTGRRMILVVVAAGCLGLGVQVLPGVLG